MIRAASGQTTAARLGVIGDLLGQAPASLAGRGGSAIFGDRPPRAPPPGQAPPTTS